MNNLDFSNSHFIDEPIQVQYEKAPALEKSPTCPSGFIWHDTLYSIEKLLAEWKDFGRRGRAERNMRPEHATRASVIGSWGVGRFYFRVQVHTGQVFDIYYDRAPQDIDTRKGSWILYCERSAGMGKSF